MKTPFTMIDELLGEISFEPLNLENHIQQVHTWTTAKHASFWGMQIGRASCRERVSSPV